MTTEPSPAARQAVRKIMLRLLPPLALAHAMLMLDRAAVGFAAPQIAQGLAFDAFHIGLVTPILFLGILVFEVPSALVADRIGARRWLAALLALWGVASLGTAAATTQAGFYVARCGASIAQAGFVPVAVLLLSGWVPAAHRTRVLGWLTLGGLAGAALSPLVVQGLLLLDGMAGLSGWRWLFLAIGVPCLALALLLWSRLGDAAHWLGAAERDALAWLRTMEAGRRLMSPSLAALLDIRLFLLAGISFGLSLSMVAGSIWYASLLSDNQVPVLPVAAGILLLSVVTVLFWCRKVDRSGRLLEGLTIACALAAVSYACGVISGSRLTMLVGLAAHAATLAAARSMLLSATSGLLALRGGGAAALAVIDATGLVAAFVSPRVVAALAEQAHGLHAGLLGIILVLVVTAGLAGSLRLIEQRG